jgi:RND family efflux transporter MFP subunit
MSSNDSQELPHMENKEDKPDISALRIDRDKKYRDRPRSRVWRWVIVVAAMAVVVIGYFLLKEEVTPATKVKVAPATLLTGSDAAADLVATGYVVAQRKAEVSSKATGRLVSLEFEEGDTVAANQVIARLDNADFIAMVEQAEAAVRQARVDTLNYGRNYRRAEKLFQSGAVTDVELENAETAYLNSQAVLAGAQAALKVAEVELENTYIRAPFSGTILTKNAEVGEMVAPFASSASSKGSVVTMADMNSLEVEADVSESNIYKVSVGQPCEIILDAYPNIRYAGYVKKIVPTADRARATVLTRVAFKERDARVLPEMSARINFFSGAVDETLTSSETLTVPKDAVTTRDGERVVFVVGDGTAIAVPVKTGSEIGKQVEIISGLNQGDLVVISPPGKMQSEQKIEISP